MTPKEIHEEYRRLFRREMAEHPSRHRSGRGGYWSYVEVTLEEEVEYRGESTRDISLRYFHSPQFDHPTDERIHLWFSHESGGSSPRAYDSVLQDAEAVRFFDRHIGKPILPNHPELALEVSRMGE